MRDEIAELIQVIYEADGDDARTKTAQQIINKLADRFLADFKKELTSVKSNATYKTMPYYWKPDVLEAATKAVEGLKE